MEHQPELLSNNIMDLQQETEGQVALVTGGSGFLGQHIVKLLHERAPQIKEIRIFDIKPYKQILDFEARKPEKRIVGDIRSKKEVTKALEGVDTVFHTAAMISYGTHPNFQGMQEINVKGTENVVSACQEQGVSRLVNTSTIDVVVGSKEIINGDENTPTPDDLLFPGYPITKYQAECMVLKANGMTTSSGNKLHTLSLRPNVMYGEQDTIFIPGGLKCAKAAGGIMRRVGECTSQMQHAYVGNMAWAHVVAAEAMTHDPEAVGGQSYFVTDDTPLMNSFDIMKPYLEEHGMSLSERKARYWVVYPLVKIAETICLLLSPIVKLNLPVETYRLTYINNTYTFNGNKARKMLGYNPIYSYSEAKRRSLDYYKIVDTNAL